MNVVFLDTVGLVALFDARDQWHEAARACFGRLMRDGDVMLTTSLVYYEVANACSRSLEMRRRAVEFREMLIRRRRLVAPAADELASAWAKYAQGTPGSIVDLTSFEVMRRLRIDTAFTNDNHFRTAGFVALF